MAKSQYTDSIIGDILIDIKAIDNKIMNFGNIIPTKVPKNMYTSTTTKYSPKGIAANSYIYYNRSIDLNTFTLSWWQNTLSNDVNNGWDGIAIQNQTVRFHVLTRQGGQPGINISQYTPSWNGLAGNSSTSAPSNNTWYHYAFIYDGTTYKVYRNGTLLLSSVYSKIGNLDAFTLVNTVNPIGHSIFDDVVLIKDQVLWTSNFTPPNYLLTGDKDIPKKLQSRMLYYPVRYGDYFDKAFLY